MCDVNGGKKQRFRIAYGVFPFALHSFFLLFFFIYGPFNSLIDLHEFPPFCLAHGHDFATLNISEFLLRCSSSCFPCGFPTGLLSRTSTPSILFSTLPSASLLTCPYCCNLCFICFNFLHDVAMELTSNLPCLVPPSSFPEPPFPKLPYPPLSATLLPPSASFLPCLDCCNLYSCSSANLHQACLSNGLL